MGEMTTYPIEIYTGGSKDGSMVGAGAAIFYNKQLAKQCKYKLHSNWHVARMGEESGVHRVLIGKPERKRPLWRTRSRWEDTGGIR